MIVSDPMSFICATCGERHDGVPGLSFDSPVYYRRPSPDEPGVPGHLTADTCTMGEDCFVRGCLEIPVHGGREPFVWGVWVSLSKVNFDRYVATLGRPSPAEGPYFGWLSNSVPGYPETLNLKTHVRFREDMLRPTIELEPTDHPLAVHQRDGISPDALRAIVEAGLHQGN